MRLIDARRDLYRRLASAKGYRSRAAFKLLQLDKRYHIFREGDVVLDLGAAPGGWLQVASEKIGSSGRVIGVDLKSIPPIADNVVTIRMDVFSGELIDVVRAYIEDRFDVILSDLSPNLSGVWDLDHHRQIELTRRVIGLLPHLLNPGGIAVLKVFDGDEMQEVRYESKRLFDAVDITKPPASRGQSSELYFVCRGYKGG